MRLVPISPSPVLPPHRDPKRAERSSCPGHVDDYCLVLDGVEHDEESPNEESAENFWS